MAFTNGGRHPLTGQLQIKGGVEAKTLTADLTLNAFSANFLEIDPGGAARTVTLPAADGIFYGVMFSVYNAADAAEAITIANAAGTTIVVLARGECAIVGSDGSAWQVISAPIVGGGLRSAAPTAAAITAARVLTLADDGGVFSVSQAAAYDIDLPSPTTGPGCRYLFYLTGPAAFNVTITVLGAAATFVGTVAIDGATVPATGATLTFATGAAVLGDSIEIVSISTSLYLVRAVSSGAGGITIA